MLLNSREQRLNGAFYGVSAVQLRALRIVASVRKRAGGWSTGRWQRNKLTNFFDNGCGTRGCITTTIQTNAQVTTLTRFNPFTDTPVEGTHWRKAPTFGQPLSRFAYQTPRPYLSSVGFRF